MVEKNFDYTVKIIMLTICVIILVPNVTVFGSPDINNISKINILSYEKNTNKQLTQIFPDTGHQAKIRNSTQENVLVMLDTNGTSYGHELLWKANITGTDYEESAVVYLDGIAYIGSSNIYGPGYDSIFTVDTIDGKILWNQSIKPGYASPAVCNSSVYIGTCNTDDNQYMYAFNRFTGEKLWQRSIYGGMGTSGASKIDDNKIYFCSAYDGKKIYALNKVDGSINWTYDTGEFRFCTNIAMLKDNAVYAAYGNDLGLGKFYKINSTNGCKIWSIPLSAIPWDNSITADGKGHIFLAICYSKNMNAYYESNGTLIWSYQLHGNPLSFNAYHNDVVFISDTNGYVYALNSSEGTLIWKKKIGNCIDISSPTLSGGLLFIGTRDFDQGAFFALNETTGEIMWRYPVGASVSSPPTIVNGMMLCGTDGWFMYAFDVGIGSGDWKLHRYDNWNTAYSPDGLTTWQYVKADCATDENKTICTIKNNYDHTVTNILLKLDYNVYWYDSSGTILKPDSDIYMINNLSSSSSMTFIIIKDPFPDVDAHGPYEGLASNPIYFQGSVKGGTSPYTFSWNFGDGTSSNLQNPTHNYTTIGTYNVTLTVTDENNNTAHDTTTATIHALLTIHNLNKDSYYQTIQNAVDDADPNDTLLVSSGIYAENIVINKSLILVGESKDSTIIDGEDNGASVSICADNVTIKGFTIQNSGFSSNQDGITLSSKQCLISENIFIDNRYGIYLFAETSENKISKNIITNNKCGIVIFSTFDPLFRSYSNIIVNNSIMNNKNVGISFDYTDFNTVSSNIFQNNPYGLYMYNSNDNTISENVITGCKIIGFFQECYSQNNRIIHNTFINNSNHVYSSYDSENNFFDNGYSSGGNYWDDYDEPSEGAIDSNNDGIIDAPYQIPERNYDQYPLLHPFLRGDMNIDQKIDMGDVNPFVLALIQPTQYQNKFQMLPLLHGDINQDGVLSFADINPFIQLLNQS